MSSTSNASTNSDEDTSQPNATSILKYGIPSPPSTPPRIIFNPPLYMQRRSKVHELLRNISQEYETPIQSLLEVGCGGNTPLIQSLSTCEDELPLSLLSGIDIDDALFTVGRDSAFVKKDFGEDDRWRDLTISLIHGSFEHITSQNIGQFDAISSCEVIEHLDPGPLTNFAPVLLGRMNPKVLIVTTPNRDFNALFEMPFEYLEEVETQTPYIWDPHDDPKVAGRRFYREPHKYAMRHDDHRFEWTRAEFKEWGDDAADTFGYNVTYHGCGALHDGAQILARRWAVEKALKTQIAALNLNLDTGDGETITNEVLSEAFGYCSQIAVFVRKDSQLKSTERKASLDDQFHMLNLPDTTTKVANHIELIRNLPSNLQLVRYQTFEKLAKQHPYPPSLFELFDAQRLTLKLMLPYEIQRVWQYKKVPSQYKPYDHPAVAIHTDIQGLWQSSYALERGCRFHIGLFEHLMASVDEESFNPSGDESSEGCLEFTIIQDPTDTTKKYAVLNIDLEPVREYRSPDPLILKSDSDSDGESPALPNLSPVLVDTTPTIRAKVYWTIEENSRVPRSVFFPVEAGGTKSGQGECLVLDEPIDSMKELIEKTNRAESPSYEESKGTATSNSSMPLTIVFFRPERYHEPEDTFDYAKQAREALGDPFIQNGKSSSNSQNDVVNQDRQQQLWEESESVEWETGGEVAVDEAWTVQSW